LPGGPTRLDTALKTGSFHSSTTPPRATAMYPWRPSGGLDNSVRTHSRISYLAF
jgi:hypothetical protein